MIVLIAPSFAMVCPAIEVVALSSSSRSSCPKPSPPPAAGRSLMCASLTVPIIVLTLLSVGRTMRVIAWYHADRMHNSLSFCGAHCLGYEPSRLGVPYGWTQPLLLIVDSPVLADLAPSQFVPIAAATSNQ